MEYITNSQNFSERTGIINDYDRLIDLGLVPDNMLGMFDGSMVDELRMFCNKHPEYHIVSVLTSNYKLNRCALGGVTFYLADGDSDKRLIYTAPSLVPKFRAA